MDPALMGSVQKTLLDATTAQKDAEAEMKLAKQETQSTKNLV